MTQFSVFDRRLDEAPALVPDRFSWFAALLPPVYGIAHRLWLATLVWVALVAGIGILSLWLGSEAGFWLYVLLAVLGGFEGPNLRRRGLRRRGYIYRSERFASSDDLAAVDWMRRRGQ
jgi:hypothetical protein